MASRLPLTPHGKQLWDWLTGEGKKIWVGKPHPWTAVRDFLLKHGVPANRADGEATNILMATPEGRAAFKAGHSGHKSIGQRIADGRRK
jgi:hypothetical protein